MIRAIGAVVTVAATAAIVGQGPTSYLAPLVLILGLAAAGAWKLWTFHRVLRDTDFAPALQLIAQSSIDDDCELATFASLQEAAQYIEMTRELLDGRGDALALTNACHALEFDIDAFVFSGDGMGDLAAAWALEDASRRLAEQAASRWRRPAA